MRRLGSALVFIGVLGVAVAATAPALAHEHPSGITDLVTPAVVRVEATAHVDVTLLDHIGELVHVERSYEVPIGSGTGTVVTPEGAVVTLTRVVENAKDVEVYAANKVFADHHKVKIPADFERHHVKNDRLDHHLQECYPPKRPTATCIFDVTTEIRVFPNISPPDRQGFKAEISSTADSPDGPAVLVPTGRADGGTGMPTAPLAAAVPDKDGSPVAVAGFTGRPAANLPESVDIAHLRAGGAGEGGRRFKDPEGKADEPKKLGALIDRGLLGGPVIEDRKGEVVGLLTGGGDDARMLGVREVTRALAEARVTPRRGPIDAAFEQALTRFHTGYYGDAVPAFQRVLELYPGHTVAAARLKEAQAKRGTAEDKGAAQVRMSPGAEHRGPPLWMFLVAGGVLVVAVLAAALLLWRRGGGTEAPGAAGADAGEETEVAGPPTPVPPPFRRSGETADPTVVVSRSFPPLPRTSSRSGDSVLVARDPGAGPAGTGTRSTETGGEAQEGGFTGTGPQKYCTACGMRLGPAHRFCGYCGHPCET
ncbi:hypothetical protein ACFYSC_02055 [Streptosporangium sp. NPDC004379]|uniref:hypothetical protein n=1 Tax=Streptosporangium sp. NPDC004379 TaxID=3366189 RepID=UPI0036C3D089